MNNTYNYRWTYSGCDEDLGMESSIVSNSSINASSHLGEGYEPWNARHNRHHGKGAWCAGQKAKDEFIQVQFTRVHVIARVSLQRKEKTSPGDTVGKAWVTKFVLAYSEDGVSWSEYSDGNGVTVSVLLTLIDINFDAGGFFRCQNGRNCQSNN